MASLAHRFHLVIIAAFWLMRQVRHRQNHLASGAVSGISVRIGATASVRPSSAFTLAFTPTGCALKPNAQAKLIPVVAIAFAVLWSYWHGISL